MKLDPLYDLDGVIAAAREGNLQIGGNVCAKALLAMPGLMASEGERRICEIIGSLTLDDFVEVKRMDYRDGPVEADVYAVRRDGIGWYVKFYVDEGTVVTSCHQLEREITKANGRRIKP